MQLYQATVETPYLDKTLTVVSIATDEADLQDKVREWYGINAELTSIETIDHIALYDGKAI